MTLKPLERKKQVSRPDPQPASITLALVGKFGINFSYRGDTSTLTVVLKKLRGVLIVVAGAHSDLQINVTTMKYYQ